MMEAERTRPGFALRLGNRPLVALAIAAIAFLALYAAVFSWLPLAWRTAGSPPLYLAGITGGGLLVVSLGYAVAKRSRRAASPPAWFAVHVVTAILGMVLVAVHSAGALTHAPALLFLALLALATLGIWARTWGAEGVAAAFATRHPNFRPADPAARARLAGLIARKTALLSRLDAAAAEGTFSLAPGHWCRRPLLSLAYARLVREERRLIGVRRTLSLAQSTWRRVHIWLGLIFLLGLAAHVGTVTFFAGYAAQGRPITWPHLTLW